MESERDAWGLSSADWCHVAINFKRSARIVQTSFPVLLFLKKKEKRRRTRAISPCPPPSLHPLFPIYLLSNPSSLNHEDLSLWKEMERRETVNAREFFRIRHLWYRGKGDKWIFLFFLKRKNKNVISRLVNIVNIGNLWDCDL